jgi:hypothetical protein
MVLGGQRLALLALAIITAYFGASYLAGEYEPAEAETRRPSHSTKPFVGSLNGFEFFDQNKGEPPLPRGCTPANGREATSEELATAPLDFRVDGLPSAARELSFSGFTCGTAVVTVVRAYSMPGDAQVEIARIDAARRLPALATRDDLTEVTINGKRGFANQSLPPVRHEEIYLEADPGYLYVSSMNVSHEELVKLTASIVAVR